MRSNAPSSSKWPARIARLWRCLTGLGEPPGTELSRQWRPRRQSAMHGHQPKLTFFEQQQSAALGFADEGGAPARRHRGLTPRRRGAGHEVLYFYMSPIAPDPTPMVLPA